MQNKPLVLELQDLRGRLCFLVHPYKQQMTNVNHISIFATLSWFEFSLVMIVISLACSRFCLVTLRSFPRGESCVTRQKGTTI